MRIGDLIHGLDVRLLPPAGAAPESALRGLRICDITEDSRTVMPGSLFVARKGEKTDGKAFVAGAIAAGAAAVLVDDEAFTLPPAPDHRRHDPVALLHSPDVGLATARLAERFYGDPTSRMTVIGVTGTNGKTTTTFLIHQILNALGLRAGLVGTVVVDDGTEIAPATLTTPPALELSRTFARMLEAGCHAAAMETSSHALHQRRVGALRFQAGVFTNLTGDHLDYHGTMEHYAAAKATLFEMLPDASSGGVAVVNIQDPWHTRMVRDTKARVVRCAVDAPGAMPIAGGTAPETVCRAMILGSGVAGTDVEFAGPWGRVRSRVPLVGAFNVMNALQAVAVVHAVWGGTDEDAIAFHIIARALEGCVAPPGRLEPVTPDDAPIQVFVDYAHTDDALQTVLNTVRGAMKAGGGGAAGRGGRLWCVFGCGGDRDKTKRPRMGRVAAELVDRVIITSDNPRTERPGAIIDDVLAGVSEAGIAGRAAAEVTVEPDRERAIRQAIRELRPGDALIIAGKGHEDYQILPDPNKPGGTITRHFDDREVARAALLDRGLPSRPPVIRPKPFEAEDEAADGAPNPPRGASSAAGH